MALSAMNYLINRTIEDSKLTIYKRQRIPKGQSRETGNRVYRRWRKTQRNWQQSVQKMTKNTEKLATECTEDGEKQNKNTIPYVLDTTIHKQANNVNRT